jgi:outer membrane lipoprotein-sorting protein
LCKLYWKFLQFTDRYSVVPILLALLIGGWACAVKRTIHVSPPQIPEPPKQATLAELVRKVDAWSQDINTLTAAVEFKPTTGSVYTGVINEYQNVGGFILLKKPATIRIIGQAPVVKTEIFDMVSDGKEFRVSIPPKNRFIVGSNTHHGPSKTPLENLRPQHILDALLVPPIDESTERVFNEEAETPTDRYYVINIVGQSGTGELSLKRKVWFDRSDLQIARLQLYGPQGSLLEDVRYAGYRDFQGINYPAEITLNRPEEGYKLSIAIETATFNQPIPPEKFILRKPPNSTLIELGGGQ